ncbi:MAG: hypothetical protein Q8914_02975 [Bacteroidota bacterium]|nr:hypothetical protein [Bacteroidota bacterium]
MTRKKIILCWMIALSTITYAAEWQWSVPVCGFVSPETNHHPHAFLWIPPTCRQVRAVVIGQHNMLEEGILEHPAFRQKLSRLGIAEIWITPGIDQVWENQSNERFNQLLDSLAAASGYSELSYAPIIPIGHSAYATYPWNFAAANNERTLAILSVHGDAPSTNLTGYGRPNLDWTNRTVDGIPGLMVEGEYEWWEARVQPGLNYKKAHPAACVSFLCDAGRGHFDYSDQMVRYLALFIEKAVKYRLPGKTPPDRPVKLMPIDPAKGWLANRWHKDSLPEAKAAPYSAYTGNKDNAFWYFDRETARQAERIYTRQRGKKEQYLGFSQKGQLLNYQLNLFARYSIPFKPETDGITFHLVPVFTDSLHRQLSHQHAKSKTVITRICGAVEKINDTTFTVRFSRMGLDNIRRTANLWLIASNNGDKQYKSAVQQFYLSFPYPLKDGADQQIHFDSLSDVRQGTKSIHLHAISSSGLPVNYYVQEGPAEIRNGHLILTAIPPRASYPVKVTVVAWQYGKYTEPKILTANPVVRSFYILN